MADDAHETFWQLVKDKDVCMLSTLDGGVIRARPMKPYVDEDTGEIRFITARDSAKVEEIEDQLVAGLTFCDAKAQDFVSVSGFVRVSQDRALLRALWDRVAEAYNKSPDNPDACVLIFVPTEAQYWDRRSNSLKQAWEMLTGPFSREQPDLGVVRKIDF
jgi:general stress protein 26